MATQPDFDTAEQSAVGEAMPDTELVSILAQHAAQAIGYNAGGGDEITDEQVLALNYYNREMPDVPAQEGCSSVVDGTVAVVVDNALAAVLKPFVSSDETVMFAPRGPEDIAFAEQATEYVNYIFNCDNPGFLILHDWFKDGLLTKLGVVKTWWEPQARINNRQDIPLEHDLHAALIRSHPDYMGEADGVAVLGQQVDDGRVKVCAVPPEEFRISAQSRSVEDAIYTAHVPLNVTRSDLIEMGFDPEIVEGLPAYMGGEDSTLRTARYQDENVGSERIVAAHSSQDRMALREEYIRIDYDGDGVAELRKIMRVEDTILLNEEADENPFATVCPIPMPHKVYGLSLADLAVQEQRISTVLWRQMLDNLYKSNNPRPVVGQGSILADGSTAESLGDNAPGAEILVADVSQFRFDAVPYTAGASMPMLEMVASRVEETTGVSRAGQGIDTNAIRKSGQMTATESAMLQGGKNARTEMVARIFAETGVRRLFKLILNLACKHQQQARVIRLRNQWVPMDPRGWPEMDVTISVGLGIGDKTEQVALADSVIATMAMLAQSPYADMVSPTNAYNAIKRKFTAAGIKDTDEYLTEPQEGGEEQPKPPSPEEQKLQAEMAMQQAKLQGEQQLAQMKLEMQAQEAAQKQQLAREQAEFDAQLATAKAQQEADLAEQKFAQEVRLAEQKMAMEERMSQHKASLAQQSADAKMSTNRPGGDLSE